MCEAGEAPTLSQTSDALKAFQVGRKASTLENLKTVNKSTQSKVCISRPNTAGKELELLFASEVRYICRNMKQVESRMQYMLKSIVLYAIDAKCMNTIVFSDSFRNSEFSK